MLLAAVAKVIGQPGPIWLCALPDLLGRGQKSVTLEQPFEPHSEVILKELLQPAFASTKYFGHVGNCLKALIGFDGNDDLVYKLDIGIWLGMLGSKQFYKLLDGRLVVKG